MMTLTYDPIATQTLTGNTASVSFSSIPGTYTDIVLVCHVKSATGEASGDVRIALRFNDDSANNYSTTYFFNSGATPTSTRDANRAQIDNVTQIERSSGSDFSIFTYNINNYSNSTTNKTVLQRGGNLVNSSQTGMAASSWRNTNAITKITIIGLASNSSIGFGNGSTFTLYGIKAE